MKFRNNLIIVSYVILTPNWVQTYTQQYHYLNKLKLTPPDVPSCVTAFLADFFFFFYRRFFKIFIFMLLCKLTSIVAQSYPLGIMILTNYSIVGPLIFWKKEFFKDFPWYFCVKLWSPNCAPTKPWDHDNYYLKMIPHNWQLFWPIVF